MILQKYREFFKKSGKDGMYICLLAYFGGQKGNRNHPKEVAQQLGQGTSHLKRHLETWHNDIFQKLEM